RQKGSSSTAHTVLQPRSLPPKSPPPAPANSASSRIPQPLEANDPIVLLVDEGDVWIEANLKETELNHIREGQSAEVVIDAYPDVAWTARVDSIAPATGAEFALLPPQNASGNWVKVVQRLPVRLSVSNPNQKLALRAGMTATVSIRTGEKRKLPSVVTQALALTERFRQP
ncbi:MAG: efflux RND transporter periplasmic adaptor subunit, partial [Rhodospirillaceae bacterium]